MMPSLLSHLVILLVLAACREQPEPEPDPPSSNAPAKYSSALGESPDFSSPHGLIQMFLWFDYEQTALVGQFTDGPALQFQVEAERIGQCRLLRYTATTCIPVCEDMDVCIEGECQSWPSREDRGTLEWTWPDGAQTVEPDALLGYSGSGVATGSGEADIVFDAMTLKAPTIDGVKPADDWANTIKSRGAGDAVLTWSNPLEGARVRLFMTDCEGSHGGIGAAELECEGPDSGELVLPSSFLDALDAGDWSHGECGSHALQRYTADAPEDDDSLRFETLSETFMFYRPDF
jgi:hypothetical protein